MMQPIVFPSESRLMRAARACGFERIAWSLRRLYCPVSREALVLEIGSGGNPYARANVLCDAYEDTVERFFDTLVVDRPMVFAHAERLPFKDDTFDFVIASHVLEHSDDPEAFIAEMMRVGKAGYIEVPDAFMERLTNYPFHRLEITDVDGALHIRKKRGSVQDKELFALFDHKARGIARDWFACHPFHFHVRYYWRRDMGGVRYVIENPEYTFDWRFEQPTTAMPERMSIKTFVHKIALRAFRAMCSQVRRNRALALVHYLRCVICGGDVVVQESAYRCRECGHLFSTVSRGVPDFRG